MIITKTPLRISFFGGGTDLSSFYKDSVYGSVVSSTINKYLYVTIKKQNTIFDEKYRLNYSITELVKDIDEIKNPVIRECLKFMGIDDYLYISTIADVHSQTGLGSSSALCVGLLNALYKLKGLNARIEQLAEEASHIEINQLNLSLGKQDHYSAAFGGLNYIKFYDNEKVEVKKVNLNSKLFEKFKKSILIFWTGIQRSAEPILKEQSRNSNLNINKLLQLRDYSDEFYNLLIENSDISLKYLGELFNKSWSIKKSLASSITSDQINKLYDIAITERAYGGKICGAGGGGFLMIIAEPKYHLNIINKFKELNINKYDLEFVNDNSQFSVIG